MKSKILGSFSGLVVWVVSLWVSYLICNLANLSVQDNTSKLFYVTFFILAYISGICHCKPKSLRDFAYDSLFVLKWLTFTCIMISIAAFLLSLVSKEDSFFGMYLAIWLLLVGLIPTAVMSELKKE